MLQVLVVDDSPLFRRGVRDLVIEGFQGAKVGEAGNAYEVLELQRRKLWDIVVMDISMPGMNGLDAIKQVKQEFPDLPVRTLSMHSEEHYAIRMFKAGADGYLTKVSEPEELIKAIQKVLDSGKYVSAELGEAFAGAECQISLVALRWKQLETFDQPNGELAGPVPGVGQGARVGSLAPEPHPFGTGRGECREKKVKAQSE